MVTKKQVAKKTVEKKEPMAKKPHIFIATPMYGGMATGFYTQSILSVPNIMTANNIDMSYTAMFNESLVQRARNALAHTFMKNPNYTHLMFIDADIRFNPNDIVSMIAADKDIICGIYPKKEISWEGVERAVKQGVPVDKLKHYTGSMVVNLVDYSGSVTVPINKPVEIWNGGTGFMLIKRKVFNKMKKTVPSYKNDVRDLGQALGQERIYEYFPVFIDEDERLLSEDYGFCRRARDAKFKVYAAPWVQLGHFGTYLFEGGLLPAP